MLSPVGRRKPYKAVGARECARESRCQTQRHHTSVNGREHMQAPLSRCMHSSSVAQCPPPPKKAFGQAHSARPSGQLDSSLIGRILPGKRVNQKSLGLNLMWPQILSPSAETITWQTRPGLAW